LSGAHVASALRPTRLIPWSHSTARPARINLRTRCQTDNLEERLSSCRAGYPVGSSSNFQDRRRATPRTARLSSSQVRYSCRANIGSRPGPLEPGHRRKPREGYATCGKSAPRRRSKRPKAAETLGSFTARYGSRKPEGLSTSWLWITPAVRRAAPVWEGIIEDGAARDPDPVRWHTRHRTADPSARRTVRNPVTRNTWCSMPVTVPTVGHRLPGLRQGWGGESQRGR